VAIGRPAALAAIDACRPGIDEKFPNRLITTRTAEKLRRAHDGLEKLCTAITRG